MSSEDRDSKALSTALVPATVGYCQPPVEHRFRKGQSGNPRGRPKKSRQSKPSFNPSHQPTDGLVLEEAYRLVSIREGDRMIELPAIQASTRALAISAMKGSRLAQKQLADMVRAIEAKRHEGQLQLLDTMIEYKKRWTAELKRRRQFNIDEPDPVPHPDHVILNFARGPLISKVLPTSRRRSSGITGSRAWTTRRKASPILPANIVGAVTTGSRRSIWRSGTSSSACSICSMTAFPSGTSAGLRTAHTPKAHHAKARRLRSSAGTRPCARILSAIDASATDETWSTAVRGRCTNRFADWRYCRCKAAQRPPRLIERRRP